MSEKIQPQHLGRKAMLYVRQSTAFQVVNNHETGKLQYAMQGRLRDLGFSDIEVIDEDLGRSAAGAVTRSGFERMVAEVSLGRVGAVAAREVSRFARNSREWQQLVEVCRIVDTVLIDQEMVYSPRASNDRLLLELKGSTNTSWIFCASARSGRVVPWPSAANYSSRPLLGTAKPTNIGWRRIPTVGYRRPFAWYSTSSSGSAQ